MEDIEDPLGSNRQVPGAAKPINHSPQIAPLCPPGSTGIVSPADAPNVNEEERTPQDESTAHHGGAGDEEEEMEMMDEDEMEFLEGNAQLGTLKSGKKRTKTTVCTMTVG